MKLLNLLNAAFLCLLLPACGGEVEYDEHAGHDHGPGEAHAAETPPAPTADAAVHAVRCGCLIEEVGECSEWIEVDGKFVALELPVDMGAMPFCGQDGLKARVDGELNGDTFVATTFAYAD